MYRLLLPWTWCRAQSSRLRTTQPPHLTLDPPLSARGTCSRSWCTASPTSRCRGNLSTGSTLLRAMAAGIYRRKLLLSLLLLLLLLLLVFYYYSGSRGFFFGCRASECQRRDKPSATLRKYNVHIKTKRADLHTAVQRQRAVPDASNGIHSTPTWQRRQSSR